MRNLLKMIGRLESRGVVINERIKNKELIFEQDLQDFQFKPFLDETEISVQAGKGGDGLCIMREVHKTWKIAPSGGNGHPGGSVIMVGNERMDHNLLRLGSSEFEAADGRDGKSGYMHIRKAPDLIVNVPLGTAIFRVNKETNQRSFLDEILIHGQRITVAKGGDFGLGNLDPKYRRDRILGKPGQSANLLL